MKKILFLFVLLTGCAEPDDNHGFGYGYDDKDFETGVTVQYQRDSHRYPLDAITLAYIEVQECMDMYADGPMVVIVADQEDLGSCSNYGIPGCFYFDPPLVVVTDDLFLIGSDRTRDRVLRHEFVHYLLSRSGYSTDVNSSHDPYYFDACS